MTIEFRLSLGSYASIADTCYVWSCGCLVSDAWCFFLMAVSMMVVTAAAAAAAHVRRT